MEYSLASFLPVILSAVSATAVTRAVFGTEVVFSVPNFQLTNLLELPYVMFLGVVTGIAAFLFIYLTRLSALAGKNLSTWVKFTIAGSITGLLAISTPQIMGIGYDTVNYSLVNNIGFGFIACHICRKNLLPRLAALDWDYLLVLIGPTFVIGASLGGVMGILAQPIFPRAGFKPRYVCV